MGSEKKDPVSTYPKEMLACDPPPPYEAIQVNEFNQKRFPLLPPVTIKSSSRRNESLDTTVLAQTSPLQVIEGGSGPFFPNDIFRKPPKFLLYPTNSIHSEGSADFVTMRDRSKSKVPTIGAGQAEDTSPKIPAVFATSNTTSPNSTAVMELPATIQDLPCRSEMETLTSPNSSTESCVVNMKMPRESQRMVCPFCDTPINTELEYVSGTLTHLVASGVCLFTACCCACIPYLFDGLKDVEHVCPQCDKLIGRNSRL